MTRHRQWFLLVTVLIVWPAIACGLGPRSQPQPPPDQPAEASQPPVEETSAPSSAAGEEGHSLELATEISPGLYDGLLADGKQNWYRLEVPPGHTLTLSLTAGGDVTEDLAIRLSDANQKEVAFRDVISAEESKSVTKVMNNSSGGTYFVTLYGQGSFELEIASQNQNDGDSGGDAGDVLEQATPVQVGATLSGQIGDYDQADWYRVELPLGHTLSLSFTVTGESFVDTPYIRLNDAEGREVWLLDPPPLGETKSGEILLETGGPYFVEIGQYNTGWGGYRLEME